MSDESKKSRSSRRPVRHIRWTVALLGGLAALIYLGFISRGVLG
ncbi:MAG TPA: hypothetical protein VJ902_01245 [Wenzhouxiangellaceae bacterium]|nr:hypothetical protein [Wenzhouxiangellaceae bacterium]